MSKHLGLNLTINAISAVLMEKDDVTNKASFVDGCVRKINLSSEEKKSYVLAKENAENKERHMRKSARRNLQRTRQRHQMLKRVLLEQGFINEDTPLYEDGATQLRKTWEMRSRAVSERISSEDLARVFLHMNKHRGYRSSRKDIDEKNGYAFDGAEVALILDRESITPGQYIARLRNAKIKKTPQFYPSDLREELKVILDKQQKSNPSLFSAELEQAVLSGRAKKVSFLFSQHNAYETKTDRNTREIMRAQAAEETLANLSDVLTVLLDIMSEANKASAYLGMINDRSRELQKSGMTPGQWIWSQMKDDPQSFNSKNNVFFRKDYMVEFDRIWNTQSVFYPQMTDELKKHIKHEIIYYQRDLKKPQPGFCPFESRNVSIKTDKGIKLSTHGARKAPKSSPLYQEYRMYHDINNLAALNKETGERLPFSSEQKSAVAKIAHRQKTMTSSAVLKAAGYKSSEYELNFKEIKGNQTVAAIFAAITASALNQDRKSAEQLLMETTGSTSLLDFDWSLAKEDYERQPLVRLWSLIETYNPDNSATGMDTLERQIQERFHTDKITAVELAKISLPDGHASLSHKAMKKLLPHLVQGTSYYDACLAEGYSITETFNEGQMLDKLEILSKGALMNPVAEKIVNQVIHVVNGMINLHGNPDTITIEMQRELKQTSKERVRTAENIKARNIENTKLKKEITDITGNPNVTHQQLTKWKLYKELEHNGYKSLYSDRKIEPYMVFDANLIHKEHIIPQSVIFDDNYVNYTLEFNDIDMEKDTMTARDYVLSKYGNDGLQRYEDNVRNLYAKKAISKAKMNYLLMTKGDVPNNILDRQLQSKQYALKELAKMLSSVTGRVIYTVNDVTRVLKKHWELDELMTEINAEIYKVPDMVEEYVGKDGKRHKSITLKIKDKTTRWTPAMDSRSGMVDAAVAAATTQKHIQYLNNLRSRNDIDTEAWKNKKELTVVINGQRNFIPPIPVKEMKEELTDLIKNTIVSIKTASHTASKNDNHYYKGKESAVQKDTIVPRGALHKDTIYKKQLIATREKVKINAKMTEDVIRTVINKKEREALLKRLASYDGNAKKAFTGNNSLSKNPVFIEDSRRIPDEVYCTVMKEIYSIRKPISSKLNIDKVADQRIKKILIERIEMAGGNQDKAFEDLINNPIVMDGRIVKNVTIYENLDTLVPLRIKKDRNGKNILDSTGNPIKSHYVATGENHHVKVLRDENGVISTRIVSFFDVIKNITKGLGAYETDNLLDSGKELIFTLRKGEAILFPCEDVGFFPSEMTIEEIRNSPYTAQNTFTLQKMSGKYFWFRLHHDTSVELDVKLKDITWKQISDFKGIVKIRIDHNGKIRSVEK